MSATGVNQREVADVIRQHGGTVSNIVHQRVDFLVATSAAVTRNTQAVRKARDKFLLPLVSPEFVSVSVARGGMCDPKMFVPRANDVLVPDEDAAGTSAQRSMAAGPITLHGLGVPADGRIEVLVEMDGGAELQWPSHVSAGASNRLFELIYQALPEQGYDEAVPSRVRFDAVGVSADGVPAGWAGRLWDVEEGTWRPWRPSCTPSKADHKNLVSHTSVSSMGPPEVITRPTIVTGDHPGQPGATRRHTLRRGKAPRWWTRWTGGWGGCSRLVARPNSSRMAGTQAGAHSRARHRSIAKQR